MKTITLSILCFFSASLYQFLFPVNYHTLPTLINSSNKVVWMEKFLNSEASENLGTPNPQMLEYAQIGWQKLLESGDISAEKPIALVDFSLPSTEKRLWIIDGANGDILYYGYVSHGRNSGDLNAANFSNRMSSYMSSLGFYLTAETYQGKHGYSLRLDGLEEGFNDKARERAIVIHGADYAEESFIRNTGRLGRSLGCPALPNRDASAVIDLIKEGSLLFIFGLDDEYLQGSPILNS